MQLRRWMLFEYDCETVIQKAGVWGQSFQPFSDICYSEVKNAKFSYRFFENYNYFKQVHNKSLLHLLLTYIRISEL